VYAALQGGPVRPVHLKFAAFDLLFLNGVDCTHHSLQQRRGMLSSLLMPLTTAPTAIPISIADGQLANNKEEVNRLFHHFRAQGHEGIIAKDLDGQYHISSRDPSWVKRKPEITLDLVVTGGVMAVTSKENAGMFGSYLIAARTRDGYDVVGDVAAMDAVRDRQLQNEVLQRGLLTGSRFEHRGASGTRPGYAISPNLVITVRFEGIIRDNVTGELSLRDPKMVAFRADKNASESDTIQAIEELFLSQRLN
jgi:DNA ligase-1